ncbi:hypothetical protein BDV93DRAFT_482218 [Ceratobasidium sp. AG-I]|nr:hypothetical protein BDV93DRAFT_482218 [Ceratobasidium sp. AG-I]
MYIIVVGGREFVLFRSQIERDSPNFLTSYFLNSSNHAGNGIVRLHISRDPDIFELVLRYLNGYQLVPIRNRFVPAESTPEMALLDLRADAEFYQLRGLVDLCTAQEKEQRKEMIVSYAMVIGHLQVSEDGMSPVEDFQEVIPRFSVSLLSEEMYSEKTDGMLEANEETIGMSTCLLVSSWSDHIVRAVMLKQPSVSLWQVMGWKKRMEGDIRHATIFVKLHRLSGMPLK